MDSVSAKRGNTGWFEKLNQYRFPLAIITALAFVLSLALSGITTAQAAGQPEPKKLGDTTTLMAPIGEPKNYPVVYVDGADQPAGTTANQGTHAQLFAVGYRAIDGGWTNEPGIFGYCIEIQQQANVGGDGQVVNWKTYDDSQAQRGNLRKTTQEDFRHINWIVQNTYPTIAHTGVTAAAAQYYQQQHGEPLAALDDMTE